MSTHATVENTFNALKCWAKEEWKPYDNTDLSNALWARLEQDLETFQTWQKISDLERNRLYSLPQPMYKLYCMKFCGDPSQDPNEILTSLTSPQKPKRKREETQCHLETDTAISSLFDMIYAEADQAIQQQTKTNSTLHLPCDENIDLNSLQSDNISNKKKKLV